MAQQGFGQTVFYPPTQQTMTPFDFTSGANQSLAQMNSWAYSPLYQQLMAQMAGSQLGLYGDMYGSDTQYNIAQGRNQNNLDLQNLQNQNSKYVADLENAARRYVADQGLSGTKYGADAQKDAMLGSAWYGADASKYGSDKDYQKSVYGADRSLEGTRYSSDANLRASMYGSDASKDIARTQAMSSMYSPYLQQQRFGALLPMIQAMFGAYLNRDNGSKPYLGTMG